MHFERFMSCLVWGFLSGNVHILVVSDKLCAVFALLSVSKYRVKSCGQAGSFGSMSDSSDALLAVFVFLFGGVIRFDMSYSVWLFIYQYVVITCIKWYYLGVLSNRHLGKRLLASGLVLGLGAQVLFGLPLLIAGKSMLSHQLWLNTPACLPSMFLALGLLIIALTKEPKVNGVISKAASGTLAVYLILTDAFLSRLLADAMESLGLVGVTYVSFSLATSVLIFVSCIVVDLARQRLMAPFDHVIGSIAA